MTRNGTGLKRRRRGSSGSGAKGGKRSVMAKTIAVPDRAGYLLGRKTLSRRIRRRDDNGHVS
jgi:hypothetical protein